MGRGPIPVTSKALVSRSDAVRLVPALLLDEWERQGLVKCVKGFYNPRQIESVADGLTGHTPHRHGEPIVVSQPSVDDQFTAMLGAMDGKK